MGLVFSAPGEKVRHELTKYSPVNYARNGLLTTMRGQSPAMFKDFSNSENNDELMMMIWFGSPGGLKRSSAE